MTQAAIPGIVRRSRLACAAALLVALLVTVIEVPQATPALASTAAVVA